MKKVVFLLIVSLFFIPKTSNAQAALEDVFETGEVVWFGLDFSNAKMIGPEGFSNPNQIVQGFFRSWNNLVINEPNRYDLSQNFRKRKVINDLSVVTPRNSEVDPFTLVIEPYETHELSEDDVKSIVKEYQSDKKGLGLVFIIESFNKTTELGTMYVTFFDIESKDVLLTEKMSGVTGGFGLRNHWARTVRNVIEQSGEEFSAWRNKYLN